MAVKLVHAIFAYYSPLLYNIFSYVYWRFTVTPRIRMANADQKVETKKSEQRKNHCEKLRAMRAFAYVVGKRLVI